MGEEYRIDPTISYDVVELPSYGIYYENKKKTVRVSYLTASDENILTSYNFIKSDSVIDELLKRKVLDKDIKVEEIVEEDRQAIMLFLRNTAFGSEYTMNVKDPKTGETFEHKVDLGVVSIKDFNLSADENGEYHYHLEKCGYDITFKFLSKKDRDELDKMVETWNGNGPAPYVTKKLEKMIKSVNGEKNALTISNFIEKMPIKDSQDFRKFVDDNKPGLNLTQKVTTPSGEEIQVNIGFGSEFFRPFYGL